ncbi:hypothetical protein BG51_00440 [Pseudomonas [fluorescens] ATCC 17400]
MKLNETIQKNYEELYYSCTNERQRVSLERIHKACNYLQEQGIAISPIPLERYCVDHGWGGPKAQSIRNSSFLTGYVKFRASGQVLHTRPQSKKAPPPIPDETLRAYVQLLEEERSQAVAARLRILKGLRSIPGVPIDEFIRLGFGGAPSSEPTQAGAKLTPDAKGAILKLFNPQHLLDCGLKLERDRVRHTLTGNVLLEKSHVMALKALVQSVSEGSPPDKDKISKGEDQPMLDDHSQ